MTWSFFFEWYSARIDVYFCLWAFFQFLQFFSMLFIHSAFLLWSLRSHILVQNCFASLAFGCWYVFAPSPLTSWYNFLSLFWNVQFCLYYLILSWYLFSLRSFASTFCCIVSSIRVALLFSSQHILAFSYNPSIFACYRIFLICLSSEISHPGFKCLFVFLKEPQFFRRLVFLQHRLIRLISWCSSLRYMIIRLYF